MDFLGIGGWEIFLIILIAVILWGPGRIVEIARTLGKLVHKFKSITSELTTQINKEVDEQKLNIMKAAIEEPKSKAQDSKIGPEP